MTTEQTRTALAALIDAATKTRNAAAEAAAEAVDTFEAAKAEVAERRSRLEQCDAHLREMTILALIALDQAPVPAPREVEATAEGIRIGPMRFPRPAADAPPADHEFWAAFARRLYEVGTPEARRAVDAANAGRHRGEQADIPTGEFQVTDADAQVCICIPALPPVPDCPVHGVPPQDDPAGAHPLPTQAQPDLEPDGQHGEPARETSDET